MSATEPGRREVARRVFAAEFDDATYSYSESDEERAPNYVVTPTGARVNRLFAVGVLTEVEQVSDEVLRARVVDPTGAFVVYAGQYRPDALSFFQRVDPPTFVALTGKARTFEPDDGDRIYSSVRPESVNEVDADTRDRWVVRTAEQTVERVRAFAAALDRPERGEDLRRALLDDGLDVALASGIPLAIEEYGTTTAYLNAVYEMSLDAARVVADVREEVRTPSFGPDGGGDEPLAFEAGLLSEPADEAPVEAEAAAPGGADAERGAETETEPGTADAAESEPAPSGGAEPESEPEPTGDADREPAPESEPVAESEPDAGAETEPEPAVEASAEAPEESEPEPEPELESGEPTGEADGEAAASGGEGGAPAGEVADEVGDEMYEFDDEERAEIEEKFDVGFSSGNEVEAADADETGEPGEPDFGSGETAGSPDGEAASEAAEDAGTSSGEPVGEASTEDAAGASGEASAEAVDLEDAVVDAMRSVGDGDGAEREAVVDSVAAEYGVAEADVEDAIQDALMAGRCYESGEDTLTPI
ncbi:MAG: RPA family protein [Halobacteriaceae archaeon]